MVDIQIVKFAPKSKRPSKVCAFFNTLENVESGRFIKGDALQTLLIRLLVLHIGPMDFTIWLLS
jgi:hypothetical protein